MIILMNTPRERMTPETEGVNHYNIYSQSRTELGKFLSHFTYHPVETFEHGQFDSLEGYWYWLKYRDPILRGLSGYEAKKHGQDLAKTRIPQMSSDDPKFIRDILFATSVKLHTMPPVLKLRLSQSRLPLIHAYEHQGKYSFQSSMDFIIAHINRLRLQGYLK